MIIAAPKGGAVVKVNVPLAKGVTIFKMLYLLIILFVTSSTYAFETTSESTNPFNEYMSSTKGIDLFSGNLLFSEPLWSLSGNNGLSVDIAPKYSSNMYLKAKAGNDISPTRWLGLGWELSYGSVVCDHKGTITVDDDEYYWISPEGVSQKILKFQGLNYKYYTGTWTALPTDFSSLTPVKTGTVNGFNTDPRNDRIRFAFVFEGSISIQRQGSYSFYLNSDNGSKLYIMPAGTTTWQTVVNNDGVHPAQERSGTITLQPGFHGIKVEYFQASGVFQLEVKYQPPSGVKQVVPDTILYPCAPDPKIRKWFLEKDPYSKVEAMDANGDGVYEGWIITTPEGKKLKYGNLDLPGDRKATRYTLAWNDHIGDIKYATSSTTMPALYPYQWDMSEIADPVGNTFGLRSLSGDKEAAISIVDIKRPVYAGILSVKYRKPHERACRFHKKRGQW